MTWEEELKCKFKVGRKVDAFVPKASIFINCFFVVHFTPRWLKKKIFDFFFWTLLPLFFILFVYFPRFCKTTNKHHPEGNWKIENKSNFYIKIRFFHKILLKMVKIRKNTVCDEYWISHIMINFYPNLTLIPSKFQVFSKVFEFVQTIKILSFLVKIHSFFGKIIFPWSW